MLLDTTFFVDLEAEVAGIDSAPCAAFLRAHRHVAKYVSVITLGEFSVGADIAAVRRVFRGFQPIALGRELAIFGGRIQGGLPFKMGENDFWIAATALARRLPLVTRDRGFYRIPHLRLIGY